MSMKGYVEFADGQALRVGGQLLVDAMRKQISGEDQDIFEVYWLVQRASKENPVVVFANVQADYDNAILRFSVDERDTGAQTDFESSVDFYLLFTEAGVRVGYGQGESLDDPDLARELMDRFVAVAQPARQIQEI